MKISRMGEQVIIDGQGDIVLCSRKTYCELDNSAHHITLTRFTFYPINRGGRFSEKLMTVMRIARIIFTE